MDGEVLLDRPWTERRARLEELELAGPAWQTSPTFVDQGPRVWAATAQQGMEGVVAKRVASPYRAGRRHPHWQKRSHEQQAVFLVGGYVPGSAGGGAAADRGTPARRTAAARGHRDCRVGTRDASASREATGGAADRHQSVCGSISHGRWGGRPAELTHVGVRPRAAASSLWVRRRASRAARIRRPTTTADRDLIGSHLARQFVVTHTVPDGWPGEEADLVHSLVGIAQSSAAAVGPRIGVRLVPKAPAQHGLRTGPGVRPRQIHPSFRGRPDG